MRYTLAQFEGFLQEVDAEERRRDRALLTFINVAVHGDQAAVKQLLGDLEG